MKAAQMISSKIQNVPKALPMPTTGIITFDDFNKIPAYEKQRISELHYPKIKKHFAEASLSTHPIVHIGVYANGKQVVIDGLTRRYMWNLQDPQHPAPTHVLAIYHPIKDVVHAYRLYRSIDNNTSAEKGNEVITGFYRFLGLDSKLTNTKTIKTGRIAAVLKTIVANTDAYEDELSRVDLFKDELVKLDRLGLNNKVFFRAPHFVAALMMLKAYKDDAAKTRLLLEGIEMLNSGRGLGGVLADGKESPLQRIHDAYNTVGSDAFIGTKSTGNNNNAIEQAAFVLYHLRKMMDGKLLAHNYATQMDQAMDHFNNFWTIHSIV